VSGIQRLLVWIKKMDLEAQLHAFTSMHDLVISDQENPNTDRKVHRLAIGCIFGKKKVRFVYSRQPGSTEEMIKEVEEDLAEETLREFLAYKFGVYREPEKTKSTN
jgi:hypothetical protein